MRDTDRDLTSRRPRARRRPVKTLAELRGKRVGVGAADSPQATLLPLRAPRGRRARGRARLRGACATTCCSASTAITSAASAKRCGRCSRGDGGRGVHHRRQPARSSRARARCPPGAHAGARPDPPYDHCNFTVLDGAPAGAVAALRASCCWACRYADPEVAPAARSRGPQGAGARAAPSGYAPLEPRSTASIPRSRRLAGDWPRDDDVDLGDLGFDRGGHLLVKRALAMLAPATSCRARHRDRRSRSTCARGAREQGHALRDGAARAGRRARPADDRCAGRGAERAGGRPAEAARSSSAAPTTWGLAARGALVEAGAASSPTSHRGQDRGLGRRRRAALRAGGRRAVGSRDGHSLGRARSTLPAEVEDAVVQVMTYLIENETAALLVPGALPRADPSALSRGDAAARHAGRRRGAPHRGLHAARAAAGATSSGSRRRAGRRR